VSANGQGRTIQPEDLYELEFVQEARLSPDGKTVVYGITGVRREGEKAEEYSAIWLLSLETGQRRQLTTGRGEDSGPRWLPEEWMNRYVRGIDPEEERDAPHHHRL
jgi:dipeptidyl aminopeptidase/acylaminoacyl peptidase